MIGVMLLLYAYLFMFYDWILRVVDNFFFFLVGSIFFVPKMRCLDSVANYVVWIFVCLNGMLPFLHTFLCMYVLWLNLSLNSCSLLIKCFIYLVGSIIFCAKCEILGWIVNWVLWIFGNLDGIFHYYIHTYVCNVIFVKLLKVWWNWHV